MTEEVTNLIAEAREEIFAWGEGDHHVTDVLARVTDALERSATETREAQAKAWDEGFAAGKDPRRYGDHEFWKWDDFDNTFYERFNDGREKRTNPYRPVAVVPEDPKPSEEQLAIMASRGYGPEEVSKFLGDGEKFEWREQAGAMQIDRITELEAYLKWQRLADEIGIPKPDAEDEPDPARYGVTPTPEVERCAWCDEPAIRRMRQEPDYGPTFPACAEHPAWGVSPKAGA